MRRRFYLPSPPAPFPGLPGRTSCRPAPDPTSKIGLVGTAVSDHPDLKNLLHQLTAAGRPVGISSIRADCADAELFALLKQGNVKTVALAPEAGSARLRRVINKNLTETDLEQAVLALHAAGLSQLRLYFLLGLPTETRQDVDDIPRLTKHLQHAVTKAASGRPHLAGMTLSLNSFVPKPFTPFQWAPFAGVAELKDRIKRVKRELAGPAPRPGLRRPAQVGLLPGPPGPGRPPGEFASSWPPINWAATGPKPAARAPSIPTSSSCGTRPQNELFPWDFIDHGVDKAYLWEEYQNALAARETSPCQPDVCTRCGVCPQTDNLLFPRFQLLASKPHPSKKG